VTQRGGSAFPVKSLFFLEKTNLTLESRNQGKETGKQDHVASAQYIHVDIYMYTYIHI
jgi:hypothetical protein